MSITSMRTRSARATAIAASALGLALFSARDASAADFVWPQGGPITSNYYSPRPYGIHGAIDIAGPNLSTTIAARSGTVHSASYGYNGGYGNLLIIDHESGYQTYYAHNDHFYVSAGAHVTMGHGISAEGTTGHSTGPHCHFEVRRYGAKHYVPGSVGAYVTKGAGVPLSFPGLSGETPSSGGGSSSGSSSAYPTIKYGDHGSAVLKAQHLLHDKGYYAGGLDGDFGPITLAATKKFQAHHGLVVDGIIGPHTWAALLK